jgi:hypothetical protein
MPDDVRALFDGPKYTGAPYGLRTDRVVFLVEPDRAWAQTFG